jgi:hypothetical protein
MNKITKPILAVGAAGALALGLVGCGTQADTVNYNLSQDAEAFKIMRNIKAINGITDTIILEVEGRCSLETADSFLSGAVEITCKVDADRYYKNYVYLSDNVSFSVEQIETSDADPFHYKWVVRPEAVIPDIDVQTSNEE